MQSSNIQKIFSLFSNMKHMTQKEFFIWKLKMGSSMLRIKGATKWAIHPEGGRTKIVKPWGGASSYPLYPTLILRNGGAVCFNKKLQEQWRGFRGKTEGKGAKSLIHSKKNLFHLTLYNTLKGDAPSFSSGSPKL